MNNWDFEFQRRDIDGDVIYFARGKTESTWKSIPKETYDRFSTDSNTVPPVDFYKFIDAISEDRILTSNLTPYQRDRFQNIKETIVESVESAEYYDPEAHDESDFDTEEEFQAEVEIQRNWEELKRNAKNSESDTIGLISVWKKDYENPELDNEIGDFDRKIVQPLLLLYNEIKALDIPVVITPPVENPRGDTALGDQITPIPTDYDTEAKFVERYNLDPEDHGYRVEDVLIFSDSDYPLALDFDRDPGRPHKNIVVMFKGDRTKKTKNPLEQLYVLRNGIVFDDGSFEFDPSRTKSYVGRQGYRVKRVFDKIKATLKEKGVYGTQKQDAEDITHILKVIYSLHKKRSTKDASTYLSYHEAPLKNLVKKHNLRQVNRALIGLVKERKAGLYALSNGEQAWMIFGYTVPKPEPPVKVPTRQDLITPIEKELREKLIPYR